MSECKTDVTTRRAFVRAGGAAVAGLGFAAGGLAAASQETLAMDGGPKAVTYPADRQAALTKWPRFGAAEKKALHDLIDDTNDSGGFYRELPALENEWKQYTKSPFVKAHMNGSSAITSMYFALDLPPGAEIMVPSYNFFSDCLAMRFFGYVPVFVDIDPKTSCFDLDDAKRKLTKDTKALAPMHSWGLPCELDHLENFANEKGLILLEDAAHSHGASMHGKKTGTWGQMAIFSFQGSKPLPGVEGGMGMYRTREYFERAAAFGHYEDPAKFPTDSPVRAYEGTGFGQKYRMHPFAAAVIRQQLKGLDERNAVVAKNVRALNSRLVQLPGISEPRCRADQERVYYYMSMLFLDGQGGLQAGRDAEGAAGRGCARVHLGLSGAAQVENLLGSQVVASYAENSRLHAGQYAGKQHAFLPAAATRRGPGVDRPVRESIREGLGPPGGTREGLTLPVRRAPRAGEVPARIRRPSGHRSWFARLECR